MNGVRSLPGLASELGFQAFGCELRATHLSMCGNVDVESHAVDLHQELISGVRNCNVDLGDGSCRV